MLTTLNEQQKQAVLQQFGTMLVLAGAGSGKTKVLTTRIAYLVVQQKVNPFSILAVTFTNKAAREMKERLCNVIDENIVKKMWVGTFHSICSRILRYDIENYINKNGKKWEKNFVIYDETDSNTIIKNAIKKYDLDDKIYQPKLIKSIISSAKNKTQTAYEFNSRAKDHRSEKIGQIFEEYEKELNLNNALDFDDLLLITCDLLKNNDEVRQKYFERFSHILVDEFQDTNKSQYELLKSIYTNNFPEGQLDNRSLLTVGDVDQSIYSWRGADFTIILNFQNDFKNTTLIKLEQNYRSVETILKAANYLIINNNHRLDKTLYSTLGEGEKIHCFEALDESNEANYIANKILNLKPKSQGYNDFAILYRTNSQSRTIEEALIAKGIPYKIVGGLKFYDRKEIKDIVAYLKFIVNTNDTQSLKRIINVPKRNIGTASVAKIESIAQDYGLSMFDVIKNVKQYDELSNSVKSKVFNFYLIIERLIEHKNLELGEFLAFVIEQSGYLNELKEENSVESQSRIDNLQELINVSREFEPVESDNSLNEFLSQISLVSDLDEVNNEDEDSQFVTLMTIHTAKGLEFNTVFITGLEEGIFPHTRSINDNNEMEEERRLMYVAITRAKQRLFLTNAKRRKIWGDYKFFNKSRFLNEIPSSLFDYQANTQKLSKFSDSDSSNYSYYHQSSHTFQKAVDKIKMCNSFGKDFIAPKYRSLKNNPLKSSSNNKIIINKTKQNVEKESEKIEQILKNNPIKKMLEEKKRKEEQENQKNIEKNELQIGQRVFHSKFGIGYIEKIKEVDSYKMYLIDFGRNGKKAVDTTYSNLKPF